MFFLVFHTKNRKDSMRKAAMSWTVYTIVEKTTGKRYIGRTENPGSRWASHVFSLAAKSHQNILLQGAWDRSSPENFSFVVVSSGLGDSDSILLEESMIAEGIRDGSCFNINLGSVGGDCITNHPNRDDIRRRISATSRKRIAGMSESDRRARFARIGDKNGMAGRMHTDEAKRLMSEANKGCSRNKGHKKTAEHRKRISESAKARIGTLNPFFGRRHSEESKKAIARAMAGIKPSNQRRVVVDGRVFDSVTDAAKDKGISPSLAVYRLKSSKWETYRYEPENL